MSTLGVFKVITMVEKSTMTQAGTVDVPTPVKLYTRVLPVISQGGSIPYVRVEFSGHPKILQILKTK